MNTRFLTTVSAIAILAGSTGAMAQYDETKRQPEQERDQQKQALEFMLSEDVIGSKIVGMSRETAGSIDDLIIDARTSQVKYAIASIGGFLGIGDKVVAVPMEQVRWDPVSEGFILSATSSRLEAMPSFDAEKWNELQREDWEKSLVDHDRTMNGMPDRDASENDRRDRRDTDAHDGGYQKSLVRVSDISGTAVRAGNAVTDRNRDTDDDRNNEQERDDNQNDRNVMLDEGGEKVGDIDGVIVELTTKKAPFAIISTGGVLGFGADDRVVPWDALTYQGDKLVLTGTTADKFKNLKPVKKADIEKFDSADDVEDWYTAFDVEPETFQTELENERTKSGG